MKKVFLFVAIMFTANFSQAQWQPDIRLTNNPANSFVSINDNAKVITANGDTLRVVWEDYRDVNYEIYYKQSTDGGISWGADTRLTNADDYSVDPGLLVSGSVVHVVWTDSRDGNDEIYYKQSTDGGISWGAEIRLTYSDSASESPAMAVTGSVIYVVWYDWRNATSYWDSDIYYKTSTDGGLSWGSDIRLTNTPSYSGFPGVAVSGSVVHVVWEDDRNGGTGDVYYKRSTDGGLTWGPDTRLTDNPANSWDPCIAVNNDVVRIVWEDDRDGNYEIYYKQSTDGGITWEADTRLTNNPADSYYPTIAISGSMLHVVWQDNRYGNDEIYYKQSLDDGVSWGADTRLTNATGDSQDAFIAVTDSVVHVAWNDKRDGNWEIYYKRNPAGGFPVGIENDKINNNGQQIIIYPNPASNIIHINFNNYSNLTAVQAGENKVLSIRNILGEELLRKQIQNGESVIDVSGLQKGFYFMSLTTGAKQSISTKLIIQK